MSAIMLSSSGSGQSLIRCDDFILVRDNGLLVKTASQRSERSKLD